MTTFPLYDSLLLECDDESPTICDPDLKFLTTYIPKMNSQGQELLYVLIAYHYWRKDAAADVNKNTPYGGKMVGSDVKFDLGKLPPLLQQILLRFVKKHLAVQTEQLIL